MAVSFCTFRLTTHTVAIVFLNVVIRQFLRSSSSLSVAVSAETIIDHDLPLFVIARVANISAVLPPISRLQHRLVFNSLTTSSIFPAIFQSSLTF